MESNRLPKRKQLRLPEFDYASEGCYFITICTKDRKHLLSHIVGNGLDRSATVKYTPLGLIALSDLLNIPSHFPDVTIETSVIMPNHIHFILSLHRDEFAERSRPFPTVSRFIGLYKGGVSRKAGFPVWQSSFYDHIVRNEQDLADIWNYIEYNPDKWAEDRFYTPDALSEQ